MNALDHLDQQIIAALQADGRASWTEIAATVGSSTTTVARRAQQLFGDGIVRVACVPHEELYGPVSLFLVRLHCTPGTQLRAAAQLAKAAEVRFVAVVSGGCDLVAELVIPKSTPVHQVIVNLHNDVDGILRSQADLVLRIFKTSQDWSARLLDENTEPVVRPTPPPDAALDAIDRGIIDVLSEDGRASFQSIAARFGVSERTVRRRFETLRGQGMVTMITLVPAAAMGFDTEVLFWLEVEPAQMRRVATRLADDRRVRYVAATLGESSLMCEVVVPDNADIYRFTTETLAEIPGVRAWSANVQLLMVKRGFVTLPWAHEQITAEDALERRISALPPSARDA
ncbi:Lrp/AsnC family transcriptional regulator [Allonocardiopsis opalescens]|uniref:Lrp/AsnC family transcriptional regulator n=1 Tax=Allonocardiopsis opalescens TaxID=1144618 RepID=UPI0014766B07|nr:Lrp/AsnC family transcriptional regulator [Allonocardiopsis opalescens]